MKVADQKEEHTRSYYAATATEPTAYPQLNGCVSAIVCVIGGGFTGVATALTLAERGYSAVLLEANRIGWGASGRNGGQLINGIGGLGKIQKKTVTASKIRSGTCAGAAMKSSATACGNMQSTAI